MIRTLLALSLAFSGISALAASNEIRIGAATINAHYDFGVDSPYFDTYPGSFCGVKAIRIAVLGHNAFTGPVDIGRVYLAYEIPATHGPFSAYAKVNTTLNEGESTGWIKVPNMGSCLKKVRVYAESAVNNQFQAIGGHRVVVYGQY